MLCCRCALRQPSLPIPLQNYRQLHFIVTWVKFHPIPTTPALAHFTPLPCQPLLDIPLDLGKFHGKFGDASYYKDLIHSEQTDRHSSSLNIYLGHTKSSGSSLSVAYRKLEILIFLYIKIERRLLYFSMLFDHY